MCREVHGGARRCMEVCGGVHRGVCGGVRRCTEVCGGTRRGTRRCTEVHRGVRGGAWRGAWRCTEGCTEVCGGVRRGAWRGAWRGTYGFVKKLLKKFTLNFLGKMVDISTWCCRIGTFSQKSKKVFNVLNSQGKKVIVTSCYFSCFVVSVNVALNWLFV